MNGTTLIAPMRAQPLHFGHEYYIRQLAEVGSRVIILLNQKNDYDNPFPFSVRKRWVEDFLMNENLENLQVPERLPLAKVYEYPLQADYTDFTVLTTNETDDMYKKIGFETLNHHMSHLPEPLNAEELQGYRLPIANTGRLIRRRLRNGLPCKNLLSEKIEKEASTLINST